MQQRRLGIEDIVATRAKLIYNLKEKTGHSRNIENLSVFPVNARSALKSKKENKPLLLQSSGILDLEHAMQSELQKIEGIGQLLVPIDHIIDAFQTLKQKIEFQLDTQETKAISQMLEKVQETKADIAKLVRYDLKQELPHFQSGVEQALMEEGNSQPKIEGLVQEVSQSMNPKIEQQFERSWNNLNQKFGQIMDTVSIPGFQTQIPGDVGTEGLENSTIPVPTGGIDPQIFKMLDNFLKSDQSTEVFKQGLLKLREYGVNGFKYKWESTLGKWAGNITKGLGATLQVGLAIWQISDAVKSQKRHEASMEAQRQEISSKSRNISMTIEHELIKNLEDFVDEVFLPLETAFRNNQTEENQQQVQFQKDLETITASLLHLNAIKDVLFCQVQQNSIV